jgi:hypothetical protein
MINKATDNKVSGADCIMFAGISPINAILSDEEVSPLNATVVFGYLFLLIILQLCFLAIWKEITDSSAPVSKIAVLYAIVFDDEIIELAVSELLLLLLLLYYYHRRQEVKRFLLRFLFHHHRHRYYCCHQSYRRSRYYCRCRNNGVENIKSLSS